jgi:branched-chain amino acid transport system ATP-binding protein
MSAVPCLEVIGVGKRYGGLQVLVDVHLRVAEGARHAILGPNGAGKTTLFKILSGETAASNGRVQFRGRDITGYPPYRRTALGMARTFQVTSVFPRLTALENVLLAIQGTRRDKYDPLRPFHRAGGAVAEAVQMLRDVGLDGREGAPAEELAYGEQRQLEIGLALASRPSLLLLDEPTAGLARAEVSRIVALLRSLPRAITILFIEHDMDVAFALAEAVTVLSQGRRVTEGSLEAVRANRIVQEIYLGGA